MKPQSLEAFDKLARADERVVFIGSDLGNKTLKEFRTDHPDRFFMEGISEQHIVGMAAGMALEGRTPFVSTFSTFLSRRAFEQIAIDVSLHRLPVRFLANGGGVSLAPLGPTHCATDDIALMRTLPGMQVVAPSDGEECAALIADTIDISSPIYFRLSAENDPALVGGETARIGCSRTVMDAADAVVTILSCGVMSHQAVAAAKLLSAQGVSCRVIHMHTVKPIDIQAIRRASTSSLLVTIEEHVLTGGFGSAVLEAAVDNDISLPRVVRLGLPDDFVTGYGSQMHLFDKYGLTAPQIALRIGSAIH